MKKGSKKKILKITGLTLLMIMISVLAIGTFNNQLKLSKKEENEIKAYDGNVPGFTQIITPLNSSIALDTKGKLWGWGSNRYGSLGDGTSGDNNANRFPKIIQEDISFSKITGNRMTTLAIDMSGNLWATGKNIDGCFGNGTTQDSTTLIKTKSGANFQEISISSYDSGIYGVHCLAIDKTGYLWTWGNNSVGQLGNQTTENSTTPIKIKSDTKFKKAVAGYGYSLAIDENNHLWAWGMNTNGQLGNGETTTLTTPVIIKSDTQFKEIVATYGVSLAIDLNGNLWGWGGYDLNPTDAFFGEIGKVLNPKQLVFGTKFKKVDSDSNSVLAIDENGTLWVWGRNQDGCLGNGTTDSIRAPQKVMVGTKIKEVSTSDTHSIVIDENGALWGSGYNGAYQLGISTTTRDERLESSSVFIPIPESYVSLRGEGATTEGDSNVIAVIGQKMPSVAIPLKTGYTFNGYYAHELDGGAQYYSNTGASIKSWDIMKDYSVLYAKWTANTNTPYKVEHYQQKAGTTEYTLVETDNKTGTTDSKVTATATTYTGFTLNTSKGIRSGTVAADGSLVLKLYYDRNEYNVTLNTDGGSIGSGNITKYTYGVGATLPTSVTKRGYAFGGWYTNSNCTGTAVTKISATDMGAKTYYAKWIPNTNTQYRVAYYQEKIGRQGEYDWITQDSKILTGTTGAIVTAEDKQYPGFTLNTEKSTMTGIVTADGTLLLEVYYDRNTYNVTLNTDGGIIATENELTSYIYGVQTKLPVPTKEGNRFGGWYTTSDFIGTSITWIEATETGDKTYYAKWVPNQYTVTFVSDGQTVGTQTVNHGSPVTPPVLTKPGYTLTWDKDLSKVTSNMTVTAIWTAGTGTAYKVEYYKQNLTKNGYDKVEEDSKILSGTTGASVTAEDKAYVGFSLNTTTSIATGTIAGDGSLVLSMYYDRNTYHVTLNPGDGTLPEGSENIDFTYGEEKTLPTPEKEGYNFTGWYDEDGNKVEKITPNDVGDKEYTARYEIKTYTVTFVSDGQIVDTQTVNHGSSVTAPQISKPGYTLTWDKDLSKVTSNMTVTAIWTAKDGTAYKVEYYHQNLAKTGYELAETEALTGKTGASVSAEDKAYVGFTLNTTTSVRTGTVVADGSLVLRMYYDRNTYHVTLNPGDGTLPEESKNIDYTYGEEKELPTPEKEGYDFIGWYDEDGNKIEKITPEDTGDKEYTARYEGKTGTAYKVEYYHQNLAKTGYELAETEALTGKTGDTVTVVEGKVFRGFSENKTHANRVATGVILGDGTFTLKLYYDRNIYQITLDPGEGTLPEDSKNIDYTYGEEKPLPIPERPGYIFDGWYDDNGNKVDKIKPTDDENKNYHANWVKEDEYYITSPKYEINKEENYIMKVSPNTTVTVFLSNIRTNGTPKVLNAKKEEVEQDSLVGTGYILQVDYKGTIYEYEIAVRGDLDGNGKVTVTDLSMLNQVLVKRLELKGMRKIAGDIDYSGEISVTDLSMINQYFVKKIEL